MAFELEHEALAKLREDRRQDRQGRRQERASRTISKPIQDKLAKDLGPHAVKVLGLVRNVK